MSKRVLLTGADGFIGSWLARELTARGHAVEAATQARFEITDPDSVDALVGAGTWDAVIHLAAISHVPTCERDPEKAFAVNRDGTANLLESISVHSPGAAFLFASTAQVYAAPSGEELEAGVVFDEKRALRPQNRYARTKLEAEDRVIAWGRAGAIRPTVLRFFNHSHKSQSPDFFLPHLHSVLTKAARGERVSVPVGNLDLWRDIGAVQDLVRAVELVLEKAPPSEGSCEVFNVCSGTRKHLGTLAAELARELGVLAEWKVDTGRVRPGEPRSIVGSHEKLSRATGWEPRCRTERELIQAFLA